MVKLEKDDLRIASKLFIIAMPSFYIYIQIINSYLFSFSQYPSFIYLEKRQNLFYNKLLDTK